MCTVIVEVPAQKKTPVRLLAVRDEDPARPWDSVDEWWPKLPGVIGVRDRQAGGAWLAASGTRLAVVLNRAPEGEYVAPASPAASRGMLPLHAVNGTLEQEKEHLSHTGNFNLVTIDENGIQLHSWNGKQFTQQTLQPGVHMIAHHDLNDSVSARIEHWLPHFRALKATQAATWRDAWMGALQETAALDPDDDRAIIRNNQPHGFPTQSLMVALGEISSQGVALHTAALPADLETHVVPRWPEDFTHNSMEV